MNLQVTDITISGMTCGGCASGIQSALADIDGVVDANVNFATARATIRHEDSVTDQRFAAIVTGLGYQVTDADRLEAAEEARTADLRQRFGTALALTIPIMVISMVSALSFSGDGWVLGALATPVVFWSGSVFHRGALANLRHRTATMDTLVSLGAGAAWLWSMVVLVGGLAEHVYFETAAMIVTLILLGKWLEAAAKRRSGDALRALADLGAAAATLVDGTTIAVADLAVGQRFVVAPGERVATDGVVVAGRSAVDMAMVTGEPVPVDVGPGDEVVGATINTNGSLTVEASRVGADTALAQIIRLVDQAQGSRAEVQRLADRVAGVFVPMAIGIAVLTLAAWLIAGAPASTAFTAAVAVLIIACPCALGLATPLGIMVGTGRGAELGVIIKGGEVLEDTRLVEIVVLDKTGTITTGEMTLIDVTGDDPDLVADAASLESRSEHPIAAAVATAVTDHRQVDSFENQAGWGVTGVVAGRAVRVGRPSMFSDLHDRLATVVDRARLDGHTVVAAGRGEQAEAVFVVGDEIKSTSKEAIELFHQSGLQTVLLTGDNEQTAKMVADTVGIDRVIADVFPQRKAQVVAQLQAGGQRVAMVGDGINDAPALATADLGIALGTGTDVAIEASDLTIVSGDLRAVVDSIALSRRTLATIKGNLFWAFAYNAAAIPLAAAGVLNPMIAAAAMGVSSLFVVTNSLRLRRFRSVRNE